VKALLAIVFSLLLIAAQTPPVLASMGSKAAVVKRSCCGEDCACSLSHPVAPVAPPIQSAAMAFSSLQSFVPAATVVLLKLPAAASESAFSLPASLPPAAHPPLFRLNCALLS